MLLDHYRVPVVPVFIRGTHEVMPPGKARIRPCKVTLVFGKPISADHLEDRATEPALRTVSSTACVTV